MCNHKNNVHAKGYFVTNEDIKNFDNSIKLSEEDIEKGYEKFAEKILCVENE